MILKLEGTQEEIESVLRSLYNYREDSYMTLTTDDNTENIIMDLNQQKNKSISKMNSFADNLKKLRKEFKLTQKQLAEDSGITLKSIINYENSYRVPKGSNLAILANLFDVDPATLLGIDIEK